MRRRKKDAKSQAGKSSGSAAGSGSQEMDHEIPVETEISVSKWASRKRPVRRSFPGPRLLDVALRVAIERDAYAELIAHAKASLEKEVCGVLVGDVCEDDEGVFVQVRAIIQGTLAEQGSAHVTYTQETWNEIHKTMEEKYSRFQIVGWYHSHPGYGVEFSDMDLFIQKNFFSAPTQIGLVIDPLSGDVGICMNEKSGVKYVGRFWVDGREQRAVVPASQTASSVSSGQIPTEIQQHLESVEMRLDQSIRALDDLRLTIHRFVLSMGMIIGFGVIISIAYWIYRNYTSPMQPPELKSFVRVPVKIGDKICLLGVDVVSWEIPAELLPKPAPDKEQTDNPPANPSQGGSSQPLSSSPIRADSSHASPRPERERASNKTPDNTSPE